MMASILRLLISLWALHLVALGHLGNPKPAKMDSDLHPNQHTQVAGRLGHALQGTQGRHDSCTAQVLWSMMRYSRCGLVQEMGPLSVMGVNRMFTGKSGEGKMFLNLKFTGKLSKECRLPRASFD